MAGFEYRRTYDGYWFRDEADVLVLAHLAASKNFDLQRGIWVGITGTSDARSQ